MLSRIFPRQFDNAYRGHWLGIGLLVPVVILRLVMGTNSILITRLVATSADGIPLDIYPADAAQTVLFLFALQGLLTLLIALLGVVALFRYRAMVPLIFLILLIVQLGSRAMLMLHPIVRTSAYGASPIGLYVNLALLALTAVGFALSLMNRRPA